MEIRVRLQPTIPPKVPLFFEFVHLTTNIIIPSYKETETPSKRKKGLPRKLSTLSSSPAIPAKRRLLYSDHPGQTTQTMSTDSSSWHIPSQLEAGRLQCLFFSQSFISTKSNYRIASDTTGKFQGIITVTWPGREVSGRNQSAHPWARRAGLLANC